MLKLENDKWYVGITTKPPQERFEEHRSNIRAAAWVRLHRPIELSSSKSLGRISSQLAKRRENYETLRLMRKYGINNVRGGEYTELDDYVVLGKWFYRQDVYAALKGGAIGMGIMFVFTFLIIFISVYADSRG